MNRRLRGLRPLATAILLLLAGPIAAAAEVRFHYVPVDARGNTTLQPSGASDGVGERRRWLGTVREPYNNQPRPTHLATYRHPYTGQSITVPLTFPDGVPRIEYVWNRVVYNYGSYIVAAQFLPDGSVDVIYNYGFLRSP